MAKCACGCGQETPIAKKTQGRRGIKKGDALKFIHGHNTRIKHPVAAGHTEESRQKMSEVQRGRKQKEETKQRRAEAIKSFHRNNGVYVQRICLSCGGMFEVKQSTLKIKACKYCSPQCYYKSMETGRVTRDKYADKVWRDKVKKKDGFKCAICGIKTRDQLEAHHIRRHSRFPEFGRETWNGVTLCRDCHKEITKASLKAITFYATSTHEGEILCGLKDALEWVEMYDGLRFKVTIEVD